MTGRILSSTRHEIQWHPYRIRWGRWMVVFALAGLVGAVLGWVG